MTQKTSALSAVSWLFFCKGSGLPGFRGKMWPDAGLMGNTASDRWRMLFWSFLVTALWESSDVSGPQAFIVCFAAGIVAFIINFTLNGMTFNWATLRGVTSFLVTLTLLTGLARLSRTIAYFKFERVLQKFALKENSLIQYWCPTTMISVVSVTTMLTMLRGFRTSIDQRLKQGHWAVPRPKPMAKRHEFQPNPVDEVRTESSDYWPSDMD